MSIMSIDLLECPLHTEASLESQNLLSIWYALYGDIVTAFAVNEHYSESSRFL